jgi:anti-sigma-K factor RskA
MIDRKTLDVAGSLIAKAQRTEFDSEAIALVEKSYSLLAKVITAYDEAAAPASAGTRRRERRLLRDRRATRRRTIFGSSDRKTNPAEAYRQLDQNQRPQNDSQIDFEA